MRSLYRIHPARDHARHAGGMESLPNETFYVFAEDSCAALSLAFEHSDGIAVPDRMHGWTVVKCEGIALEAE